jgi:predicted metalloprotease
MGRGGTVALGGVVVLVAAMIGGCGWSGAPAGKAVVSVTPSQSPSPSPSPSRTPSATASTTVGGHLVVDLSSRVTKNQLYAAGKVPAVSCKLPAAALGSSSQMLKYARMMVDCMKRSWAPLIAKSDSFYGDAQVASYTGAGKGADSPLCEDPPKNVDAFYRYQGSVICLDRTVFQSDDPVVNLVDFQQLLAHEYGHHVQMSVGILTSYDVHRYGTEAQQLEDERRKELQASCFGAAFLGANKQAFKLTGYRLLIWREIVRHVGDEYNPDNVRDHGSRKSHAYWTLRAFDTANPSACNTFAAPAKRVS